MDIANIAITATLVGGVLLMAFARIREQNRFRYAVKEFKRSHQKFVQTLDALEKFVRR